MNFSFKRTIGLICTLGMLMGFATACDDDSSDDKGNQTSTGTNSQKTGYLETCTPLGVKQAKYCSADDVGKIASCKAADPVRNKEEAANYLTSICELPEYYTKPEFQNKPDADQVIGSPCFCYGEHCSYMGYERPEIGGAKVSGISYKGQLSMFGCDSVPETYKGAVRSCFRSSEVEGIKPAIYFPNGACALAMSKCQTEDVTARQTICGFATFGDPAFGNSIDNNAYDEKIEEFTTCPEGDNQAVLIDFVMNIQVEGLSCTDGDCKAKLDVRACFQGCKQDSDCHGNGIYDPIVQSESQTKCERVTSRDGTKSAGVCFDMRSIKESGSTPVMVHPGSFEMK